MSTPEISLEQYYDAVFRFLRGISADERLAEELTQETFYRALKFKETYQGSSDVRVWLCSIAKNLYYSHLRKEQRLTPSDSLDTYEAEEKHFTELIADKETALAIHRILHDLRDPYKEIFSLRIFGELSFQEIGTLFDKSAHWACVTYHRAKEMIRAGMKEGGR